MACPSEKKQSPVSEEKKILFALSFQFGAGRKLKSEN